MSAVDPDNVRYMMSWRHIAAVIGAVIATGGVAMAVFAWVFAYNVDGMRQDVRAAVDRITKANDLTTVALTTVSVELAREQDRTTALTTNLAALVDQLKTATNTIGALSGNISSVSKSMSDLDNQFVTSQARQETFQRIVLATMICDTPLQGSSSAPAAICGGVAKAGAINAWLAGVR